MSDDLKEIQITLAADDAQEEVIRQFEIKRNTDPEGAKLALLNAMRTFSRQVDRNLVTIDQLRGIAKDRLDIDITKGLVYYFRQNGWKEGTHFLRLGPRKAVYDVDAIWDSLENYAKRFSKLNKGDK